MISSGGEVHEPRLVGPDLAGTPISQRTAAATASTSPGRDLLVSPEGWHEPDHSPL